MIVILFCCKTFQKSHRFFVLYHRIYTFFVHYILLYVCKMKKSSSDLLKQKVEDESRISLLSGCEIHSVHNGPFPLRSDAADVS